MNIQVDWSGGPLIGLRGGMRNRSIGIYHKLNCNKNTGQTLRAGVSVE